jgi:hypothetical protein
MSRQAVDLLLAQAQATVWLLFENEPGRSGRLVAVFSSPALAMQAQTVQEIVGAGTWKERTPRLWTFQPSGHKKSYFSLECSQVDRLTDK